MRKSQWMQSIRLVIDIFMLILFFTVIQHEFFGQKIHEITGLLLGILVITHIIVNGKRLLQLIQMKKFTSTNLISVLLDGVLILSMILLLLSGIINSGFLFRFIQTDYPAVWTNIHHISVYSIEISIVLHIIVHIRMIIAMLKLKSNLSIMICICAVIAGICGIFIWSNCNNEQNQYSITKSESPLQSKNSSELVSEEETVATENNFDQPPNEEPQAMADIHTVKTVSQPGWLMQM